ncbi:MAG: leucine-rich repeat domain-containing protein [Promethearchaeota archaeon]|jgi:Leucine-rich repeat (LRR) protein
MALHPDKIFNDLKNGKIDRQAAADLLIFLISGSTSYDIRFESVEKLLLIGIANEKVFFILEEILLSDSVQEIKELAAHGLVNLFQERSLSPLKWALDHEKSWEFLMEVIQLIRKSNNDGAKSILLEKIRNFDKLKFIKSLESLFKKEIIQQFELDNLAEIIENYFVINHLENTIKEFDYKIEKGLVVDLNIQFVAENTLGWKVLKDLPEFIKILRKVKRLELKSNNIGKFPDSIFSLKSLKYLDLSHNSINTISDSFHHLESLEYVNLNFNQLRELPKSIGSLPKLKVLNLDQNRLRTLPSSTGNLTSLEVLNLHGNQLDKISSSLEGLSALESLNVGLNDLKTFPQWIEKLTSLKKLSLGGNKELHDIRSWIEFLPSIKELNLYDNDINELPESLGAIDSLEVLILPNNHISILPASFQNLKSLKQLDLSWNNITNLPEWINSLESLEEINLRGNKLSSIPHSLKFLRNLKILNISLNKVIIYPPKDLEKKGIQIIY